MTAPTEPTRRHRPKLSAEQVQEILALLERGGKLREVRERWDIRTNTTIRAACRRLGQMDRYRRALHSKEQPR